MKKLDSYTYRTQEQIEKHLKIMDLIFKSACISALGVCFLFFVLPIVVCVLLTFINVLVILFSSVSQHSNKMELSIVKIYSELNKK